MSPSSQIISTGQCNRRCSAVWKNTMRETKKRMRAGITTNLGRLCRAQLDRHIQRVDRCLKWGMNPIRPRLKLGLTGSMLLPERKKQPNQRNRPSSVPSSWTKRSCSFWMRWRASRAGNGRRDPRAVTKTMRSTTRLRRARLPTTSLSEHMPTIAVQSGCVGWPACEKRGSGHP